MLPEHILTKQDVVLTLDAGGTKFSFSALAGGRTIAGPLETPSHGNDLQKSRQTIRDGFHEMHRLSDRAACAISFGFPGPSWYREGIIGDLGNLPAYRGGVALGPMLQREFSLPVFINNDGDLFALGEAVGGFLPEVNNQLTATGNLRQYRNLIGLTLGTGFGGGIARDGRLFSGDNSAAGEVWLYRNPLLPDTFIEESISIRALQRIYREESGNTDSAPPSALEVYRIAKGMSPGNPDAAMSAFRHLGTALGEAVSVLINTIDGLVVIGGGLSQAWELFAPAMMDALHSRLYNAHTTRDVPRPEVEVYNAENPDSFQEFLRGDLRTITVPGSTDSITFDARKATAVGLSRLGTSQAIALGAFVVAAGSGR